MGDSTFSTSGECDVSSRMTGGLCLIVDSTCPARHRIPEAAVAKPKKLRNPTTSVTVVRMIDEAWAGSWPNFSSRIGIEAPASPAIAMDEDLRRCVGSQVLK